jgi:ribosomal protein S17E
MVLLKTSDDNKSFLYFNTNDSSVGVYALDYQSNHLKNAMANYLASSMMKHGA